MAKVDSLKRFDVFAELPGEALEEIARLVKHESHPEGTVLFKEGAAADKLYLLLEGKISLEMLVQLGRPTPPRCSLISSPSSRTN
jgi:CRP-like cAMP-binding protein